MGPPRGALCCWPAMAFGLSAHGQNGLGYPASPFVWLPPNRHPAIKHLVLVVDDEPAVRGSCASFAMLGTPRLSWRTALRRTTTSSVRRAREAIISDEVMPRLRGSELVAKLKDTRPQLPIVLVSAYSIDNLRSRGLDQRPGRTADQAVQPRPARERHVAASGGGANGLRSNKRVSPARHGDGLRRGIGRIGNTK